MKSIQIVLTSTILTILTVFIMSFSYAQDNTQAGLPEGAIARLGKGGINIMQFSPDGTQLAVGTDVGVWLYNVSDGKETALFTGHTGHVNALAFSQDRNILASGGFNNPVIQIWDLETKDKHSEPIQLHDNNTLNSLVFYGRNLISIAGHDDISYWDITTRNRILQSNIGNPYDVVTFSRDGKYLAYVDRDGKIHLWDTTTSSHKATLKGHGDGNDSEIRALSFSMDGKILASGSDDRTVKLWDTQNNTELSTLYGHLGWVTAIAFSEDGNTLASGDANKTVKLWDLETKRARATIRGHKNTIIALTFAPDGESQYGGCLASGSADGTIRFWNPNTGKELITFTKGHTESVKSIAFSEFDTRLASGANNGIVDVWNIKSRKKLDTYTYGQCDVTDTAIISSDATHFARSGSKGLIVYDPVGFGSRENLHGGPGFQLWEITTGNDIKGPWHIAGNFATEFVFSPIPNIIAVNIKGEIRTYHVNTGDELFRINARWSSWRDPVFSPDGKWVAYSAFTGLTTVWNVEALNNEPAVITLKRTKTITFSPDSSILAIAADSGIHLWKHGIQAGDETTIIPGNLRSDKSVLIFSPDGNMLVGSAMVGWDNPIKVWDI